MGYIMHDFNELWKSYLNEKKEFSQLKIKVGWSMPQRISEDLFFAGEGTRGDRLAKLKDFKAAVAATQKTILLNLR